MMMMMLSITRQRKQQG